MYLWTMYLLVSGDATSWRTIIILTINAAHSNGLSGLMGHELFHKRSPIHKFVGTFTLCKFLYGHFVVEHCLGHHINVCTPDDPATALYGESYYRFLFRSSIGGIKNAFKRECERLKRWNLNPYGLKNTVIFNTL